jgi:oligoendopeptidase F
LTFIPDDFDASKWENIEPYVNDLLERKLSCSDCLEDLISDSSNLAEHISETGALLYINMTCDTEDEEKRNEFLSFVENIRPKLSKFSDELNRRIVDHESIGDLPSRYDLMIRGIKSDIEIFREENIPLGVEQTKLVTKAQGITGAMTVVFDGEERTFPEMRGFLESNDRIQRERAWKSMVKRWMENSEELSDIFDDLVSIRHKIALNSGFKSYTNYMFRAMHRFDYTVEDCLTFHKSIEEVCMPIVKKINSERKNSFDLKI